MIVKFKLREGSFLALVSTDSLVCSNDTDKNAAMGPTVLAGHTTGHELQQPSNTRQHKTIPLTRDSALPGQTVTLHCVAQTTNTTIGTQFNDI